MKNNSRAVRVAVAAISVLLLSNLAEAQDVDVPGNLTMTDSTATQGNILKDGAPFLHNFGVDNTFIGKNAGNLSMDGYNNTACGGRALVANTSGAQNTASGFEALLSNTTGDDNTATGSGALRYNTSGRSNTASGVAALYYNAIGYANTASGVAALYRNTTGNGNTASGLEALFSNTTGSDNSASGFEALLSNTTGSRNTASGVNALRNNMTGDYNAALGYGADVFGDDLFNATAIGAFALVNASNKIRLGNTAVTVIEGQVGFTASSDVHQKENFEPVDGEVVLGKIRGLSLTSWNFIGHDPKQFRHYGPMAQDFFAAFGHDGIGTVGTDTTITSTDMDGILMIAVQALERRTHELGEETAALRSENAGLKARLEALERRISAYALTKAE